MKRLFIITAFTMITATLSAQQEAKPFRGYFVNDELEVYLRINLYDNMDIPEHELFGPLPGFLARQHNGFYWLITDAKVKKDKASVDFINDYGSDDLTATFHMANDSTLILEQKKGSSIKVPKNGKWIKLPSKITFRRK